MTRPDKVGVKRNGMNDVNKEIQINKMFEPPKKGDWTKEPLKGKTDLEWNVIIEEILKKSASEMKEEWKKMILRNKECFGQHISEIGTVESVNFTMEIDSEAEPYFEQPYNLSPEAIEEITKQMKELIELEIIEPAENPTWMAQCLAIPKKADPRTGHIAFRIAQDYRKLNAATKSHQMVFPRIEDIMTTMSRWLWFIGLDCLNVYYHIKIPRKYRLLMAFGVPRLGAYQPTRMFFELKNVPAIYQSTLNKIL